MSCSPAVGPLLTTRFLFWDRGCHGASRRCEEVYGPQGHWVSGVSWGVGVSGAIGVAVVWAVSGYQYGMLGALEVPRRCQGCIGVWQGV